MRLPEVTVPTSPAADLPPELHALLRELFAGRSATRVALLGPPPVTAAAAAELRAANPGSALTVTEVDPAAGPSAVHVRLSSYGPYDLIVDLDPTSGAAEQAKTLLGCFFHLAPGGTYVVADSRPWDSDHDRSTDAELTGRDVRALLGRARTVAADDTSGPVTRQDLRWIGLSLGETVLRGRVTAVGNRRRARPRLRDHEIDPVLKAVPRLGRVLETRPGGVFVSRGDYADNSALLPAADRVRDPYRLGRFDVPDLRLRRYLRPVISRGQVVESRGLLLPDTFRHHRSPRLDNVFLHDLGARFAEPKDWQARPVDLVGGYFHLDSEWPGHFGHTVTEQISRLWAFDRVRELEPDLKVATTLPRGRPGQQLQDWEVELLGAFDLDRDDVLVFDQPVRPQRLYAATPMFSCPHYVHPDITRVWDRIADRLLADHPVRPDLPRGPRLFCSRPQNLKRPCHNAPEVEAFFAARGFAVVRPEDFTLTEQIAMFRAAEIVAGFAGSGLFTTAFVPRPTTVLMIAPDAYTARNEWLFASARGHRLRTCWSRSDLRHPPGEWTVEAFSSAFSVDLERDGPYLDSVIEDVASRDAPPYGR